MLNGKYVNVERKPAQGPRSHGDTEISCDSTFKHPRVLCASVVAPVEGRRMQITSFEEFKALAQRGTFVPVCKELVADMLTPVSAFLKIAEHSDHAFLLESVEGGEQVGRYSFIGKDPFLILRSRGGRTIVEQLHRGGETTESDRPLIETLRELMAAFQLAVRSWTAAVHRWGGRLSRLRRGRLVRAGDPAADRRRWTRKPAS